MLDVMAFIRASVRLGLLRDRLSLSTQAAAVAGLLCIFTAAVVSLTAATVARQEAASNVQNALVALARDMADRLDQHMFERFREVRNLASLPPLRPLWPDDVVGIRSTLEQLQSSLPNYAWIGFATPDGKVKAATGGLLEGASVAQRPWFMNGIQRVSVEDVHDAKLLDKLLRTSPDEPPFRFVDVAVPVLDSDGKTAGVVGAHLSWHWADEVRSQVLADRRGLGDVELLVYARDGQVLIGTNSGGTLGQTVLQASHEATRTTFSDQRGNEPMLAAAVATSGLGEYPGLGWIVVARQSKALAMAAPNRLFFTILAVGAFAAAIGAFLAYVASSRVMRSLEALHRDIDSVGRDPNAKTVERRHGSRDVISLSTSVRSLLRRIGVAEQAEQDARNAALLMNERAVQLTVASEASDKRAAELQRAADTDPLTGLLNRRAFLPLAEEVLREGMVGGERAVAVLLVDIDHFKRINDTYGHAVGDRVIRTIAQVLRGTVREDDSVARFGGEEFVILLKDTSPEIAEQLAERVRESVAATAVLAGRPISATISVGVALATAHDRDVEDLIIRADKALYKAKSQGRNRVVMASEGRASDQSFA